MQKRKNPIEFLIGLIKNGDTWLVMGLTIVTVILQKIEADKTILLSESNSDPSIVESFLIDEKKTTLPLLISRVLQRLNGQKWIGAN